MCNIIIHPIERKFFSFKIFTKTMIFIQRFYRFIGQIERFLASKKYFMHGYNFMLSKRKIPFSLGSFALIALGGSQL